MSFLVAIAAVSCYAANVAAESDCDAQTVYRRLCVRKVTTRRSRREEQTYCNIVHRSLRIGDSTASYNQERSQVQFFAAERRKESARASATFRVFSLRVVPQIQLDGGDHETPRFDCRWNILPFLLGLGSKCARRAPVVARPESVSRTWSAPWHRPEPQRLRALPTAGRLGLEQLCSPDRLFLL